jgi:hypothetical protein
MRTKHHWGDMPLSATFRIFSAVTGGGATLSREQCRTRIAAPRRGSAIESLTISVMAGLAVLSVTCGLILDCMGPWGLVFVFPAWGVVLHVIAVACAGLSQLFCVAGVLRPSLRPAVNGLIFGLSVAAAVLLQLSLHDPVSWLAFPWLGFIAMECLLWPTCRVLDTAEKE